VNCFDEVAGSICDRSAGGGAARHARARRKRFYVSSGVIEDDGGFAVAARRQADQTPFGPDRRCAERAIAETMAARTG